MLIRELGLRPSLTEEDVPPAVRVQQDMKMLNAINRRARQNKEAKKARRQLKAVLAKVDAAIGKNCDSD